MQVKDLIVSDVEQLMDELIKTLIKLEISYVRIDNEIHFDNYIYRFYDIRDFKVMHTDIESVLTDLSTICVMPRSLNLFACSSDRIDNFIPYIENERKIIDRNTTSINKKMIKAQNRINNRLVNTSRKK